MSLQFNFVNSASKSGSESRVTGINYIIVFTLITNTSVMVVGLICAESRPEK